MKPLLPSTQCSEYSEFTSNSKLHHGCHSDFHHHPAGIRKPTDGNSSLTRVSITNFALWQLQDPDPKLNVHACCKLTLSYVTRIPWNWKTRCDLEADFGLEWWEIPSPCLRILQWKWDARNAYSLLDLILLQSLQFLVRNFHSMGCLELLLTQPNSNSNSNQSPVE